MAETPDQTRREIEETRQKITEAAEELEERFEETTDWRKLVARYPMESFLAVLGVGFIIGSTILSRRPRRIRVRGTERTMAARRALATSSNVLNLVRPIITPVITARLLDYMRKRSA